MEDAALVPLADYIVGNARPALSCSAPRWCSCSS
jgi:hypothetical protein